VNAAQSPTQMNNFKGDFLNVLIFLQPQIPDIIVVSRPNIVLS